MSIEKEFQQFRKAVQEDPDLIWAWHSNIAMPIYDNTELSIEDANDLAVKLMKHLFDIDSSEIFQKQTRGDV